jgi:hypothetical protein
LVHEALELELEKLVVNFSGIFKVVLISTPPSQHM